MTEKKERGPSAYNTPYDELPEYFAVFSPYTWLWLIEIMLMLIGGTILVSLISDNFLPSMSPAFGFIMVVFGSLCISIPNFMLAYGYNQGVLILQLLCLIYIVGAVPHFFFDYPLFSLLPLFCGIFVLWIINTEKFKVFVFHRVKMGEWKRDQLEKNKVRREVIRERKAEEKMKRKKAG